jgi:thiosulfate dehydrogenase
MKSSRAITTGAILLLACTIVSFRAGARGMNDPILGGKMWDTWWVVVGTAEPTGDHPLYPPEGEKSGSTTFRCKECHGWDYKGADGAYGSGSHFTGIPGVFGSTLSASEMFDLIKLDEGTMVNGHGYGALGMTDQDLNDVVEFLQTMVIDTDDLIDGSNLFIGDEAQGEINYTTSDHHPCTACHGADGTAINFGSLDDPEWVGTIAVNNPWELQHKLRFGQPGSGMPSWLEDGGDNQGVADIGVYAQLNLPVSESVPVTDATWSTIKALFQ